LFQEIVGTREKRFSLNDFSVSTLGKNMNIECFFGVV
jgi:hypothetical protein